MVNSVHSEVCNKLLRHYTKVTSVNFRGLFSPIHTDLRLNLARRCQAPPERTSSRNRSTNFSFSPGAVFRGKPKVAAGIPTSLKMLTSRHMLISGRNRRAFSPSYRPAGLSDRFHERFHILSLISSPRHVHLHFTSGRSRQTDGYSRPLFGKPAGQGRIGQLCTGGIP